MVKPQPLRVVIFAGPNGAGKSTHADAIVAALGINTFVNADYIARGLSGRNADAVAMQAGRIVLTRLKALAAAKQDFAFESTLSSRSFAPFLRQLKRHGCPLVASSQREPVRRDSLLDEPTGAFDSDWNACSAGITSLIVWSQR